MTPSRRSGRAAPRVRVTVRPVTPDRWPDLVELFGPRGACGGCWCMWWRLPHARYEGQKGAGTRRALKRLVAAGRVPGLLAYHRGRPVGWVALAPREVLTRLGRSRVLAPVDVAPVWSVVCLFIARAFRRRGLSVTLYRAAVREVRRRGARLVEAYPIEPRKQMADAFVSQGLASACRAAGRSNRDMMTARAFLDRAGAGPASAVALVVTGTLLSYGAAWTLAVPWLVPVLNTLAALPVMVALVRAGRVGAAIAAMLAWALAMAVCATTLAWWRPEISAGLFVNARAYQDEMFGWVRTGLGAESDPRRFLPQHAGHAALFCALSFATGGVLSMPMGAVLMNDMGHYAGALAARSDGPLATALLAWHPWAVVRVASFVTLGVLLAGPLWARLLGCGFAWRRHARLAYAAALGLAIDAALKALLAPWWRELLRARVEW